MLIRALALLLSGYCKAAAGPNCFVARPLAILTYVYVRSGCSQPAVANEAAHFGLLATLFNTLLFASAALAQVPPTRSEIATYTGLIGAATRGAPAEIAQLATAGANMNARDSHGRTPLHVATYARNADAMRALVKAGADPNALENDRYDIATIAAVAADVPTLVVALDIGCKPTNITSRWNGTALIAAAHLGHDEVVRTLIRAGAPLDHVNNLGWTALIESIVLGNGGPRHVASLQALVAAGANVNLGDRSGVTPLAMAKHGGFSDMVAILEKAGAR